MKQAQTQNLGQFSFEIGSIADSTAETDLQPLGNQVYGAIDLSQFGIGQPTLKDSAAGQTVSLVEAVGGARYADIGSTPGEIVRCKPEPSSGYSELA